MPGLHGETGSLTGLEFLEVLEKLKCSGTLVLEKKENSLIILLNEGQLETSYKLGQFNALDTHTLDFHFEPHKANDLPSFESRFPHSILPVMRALPAFGSFNRILAQPDLSTLLTQLREEAFNGCLTVETNLGRGLILFQAGKIGAAFSEEDAEVRDAVDALRVLRRIYLQETEAQLYLRTLSPFFVRCLLGVALQQSVETGAGFTGLESSEEGYTFFDKGQPLLRVHAELRGNSGRYAHPEHTTELSLPDEPPGWEQQRYGLTLRGKDALNPMTELSLEFSELFGHIGKNVLEHLKKGSPLDSVAQHVNLELSDFKTYLDKLEQEGLIQQLPR